MKFTIKPLEWEVGEHSRRAGTPFGSYQIERDGSAWVVAYCFDEYYDEGEIRCVSLGDAYEEAQRHWVNRLMPALEEAPEDGAQ